MDNLGETQHPPLLPLTQEQLRENRKEKEEKRRQKEKKKKSDKAKGGTVTTLPVSVDHIDHRYLLRKRLASQV